MEFSKIASTHIVEGLAQPASQLVKNMHDRPFVRDLAFDAFRHIGTALMKIALECAGTFFHRAQRTHAIEVLDELLTVEELLARRLIGAGEHIPRHTTVSPRRKRLTEIPRLAQSAIGNNRYARALSLVGRFPDCLELRFSHTGHPARGAYCSAALSDNNGVSPCVEQISCARTIGDVACGDIRP